MQVEQWLVSEPGSKGQVIVSNFARHCYDLLSKQYRGVTDDRMPMEITVTAGPGKICFDIEPPPKHRMSLSKLVHEEEVRRAKAKTRNARNNSRHRGSPKYKGVVLPELLDAGLTSPGMMLFSPYPEDNVRAFIADDGNIEMNGTKYYTPTEAQRAHIGKRPGMNGWRFWQVDRGKGDGLACLADLRDAYMNMSEEARTGRVR